MKPQAVNWWHYLKESEEIKRNKPIYNRALRRTIFTHALYSFIDEQDYINLKN